MDDSLDPVLRCDSCSSLVKVETLHSLGCCSKCGNRRIRNLTVMDEVELQQIKDWGFTEFASQWGAIND